MAQIEKESIKQSEFEISSTDSLDSSGLKCEVFEDVVFIKEEPIEEKYEDADIKTMTVVSNVERLNAIPNNVKILNNFTVSKTYLEKNRDNTSQTLKYKSISALPSSQNNTKISEKATLPRNKYRSMYMAKSESINTLSSKEKIDIRANAGCNYKLESNTEVFNIKGIMGKNSPKLEQSTEMGESTEPINVVYLNDYKRRNNNGVVYRRPVSANRHFCSYCSKSFFHNSELTKHVRTHTGEKPFKCPHCEKPFGRKTILNAHIRIHTGEKPYKCNYCEKYFKDKSNRNIHMRIHTLEKPYSCSFCEKKFYQKSNLIVHVRTHTGIKPYSCNYCEKQFIQKPDLKKHIRIHTGEKPYSCVHCEKKFSDKSTYNSHIKAHLTRMTAHTTESISNTK